MLSESDIRGSSLCGQCDVRCSWHVAVKRVTPTGAVRTHLAANQRRRTCGHVPRVCRQTLRVASKTDVTITYKYET